MILHEYDEVMLNNGDKATILEILGQNECYVAEVHYKDKSKDIDGFSTEFIYPNQIEKVIKSEVVSSV